MSAAYTPGSWETSTDGKTWEVCGAGGGDIIADIYPPTGGTAEANARLIALAPDMLEALRDIATCENADYMRDRAQAILARLKQ